MDLWSASLNNLSGGAAQLLEVSWSGPLLTHPDLNGVPASLQPGVSRCERLGRERCYRHVTLWWLVVDLYAQAHPRLRSVPTNQYREVTLPTSWCTPVASNYKLPSECVARVSVVFHLFPPRPLFRSSAPHRGWHSWLINVPRFSHSSSPSFPLCLFSSSLHCKTKLFWFDWTWSYIKVLFNCCCIFTQYDKISSYKFLFMYGVSVRFCLLPLSVTLSGFVIFSVIYRFESLICLLIDDFNSSLL